VEVSGDTSTKEKGDVEPATDPPSGVPGLHPHETREGRSTDIQASVLENANRPHCPPLFRPAPFKLRIASASF